MRLIFTIAILIATLLATTFTARAEYHSTIDLKGNWKFSIGDNTQWASPTFNDTDWPTIYVPDNWEDQGYQGYNGIAWYRNLIFVPDFYSNRQVILELGYIDDCDEVFINGVKIGQSGTFPPNSVSSYSTFRKYIVPNNLIKFGQRNLLAVRVYDSQLEGGIVRGDVRLCAGNITVVPDISLNGTWNFDLGRKGNTNKTIQVPGRWEDQGFYNYNGIGVYSRTVKITAEQLKKSWVFLAGRIDDIDEFYINGKLVAQTGDFRSSSNNDLYAEFRNYFIPADALKVGDNIFEIRVKDLTGEGGIVEGNVGLITQENFIKSWRLKAK